MAVVSLGLETHQAMESVAREVFNSLATTSSFFTLLILSSTIQRSLSQSNPSSAKRLFSGMPLLYLPESNPDASGLQMVVPMPTVLKIIRNSYSIFCLSSKLYCGCSTDGPMSENCAATRCASMISAADHSLVPQ